MIFILLVGRSDKCSLSQPGKSDPAEKAAEEKKENVRRRRQEDVISVGTGSFYNGGERSRQ